MQKANREKFEHRDKVFKYLVASNTLIYDMHIVPSHHSLPNCDIEEVSYL